MVAIKLNEIVDEELVKNVILCNNIPGDDDKNIQTLLKSYNGKVTYNQIKNFGRYYAKGALSLQSFQRDIRKYLSNGNYVDIDIVNCHPVLLEQLFIKYNLDIPGFLLEYNNNREKTIKKYKLSCKLDFLKKINTETIKCNEKLIIDCHKSIYNNLLPLLLKDYKVPKTEKVGNENGSKFAKILQHIENEILQIMFKKCEILNVKVGVLVFDGMMIETESYFPELLSILEKEVKENTGYTIKLDEKSMKTDWKPTFYGKQENNSEISNKSVIKFNKLMGTKGITKWETIETENGYKSTPIECYECLANPGYIHNTFNHSSIFANKDGKQVVKSCFSCQPVVINDKKKCKDIMNCLGIIIETQENNTYQGLVKELLEICNENEYMREESSGIVYKKVKNYAYVRYLEPNKFLNKIFYGNSDFISNVNNMDNMIKFIKQYDNADFPFLEYNKDYLGFTNGVFNTKTCEFYDEIPSFDKKLGGSIVRKYFDKEFNKDDFDTPLMDKILDFQFSAETRDFIYACLGRMFGIRDNFGFMLYLLGEASTGKSLIIDVISACFENVGCINDGFENTFGLSSLYKKDIVVTDDLPKHISKIFPQQLFQTCITNGNVSIPIKNSSAINMIWHIPLLWAGNFQVSYIDQGQISRRILIANFAKFVNNPDTSLKTEIIKNELPSFINKCCHYYKKMLDESHNKTIWKICPEYFLDQQEELKMERNPLYKFLMENTRYKEGEMLTLEEVRNEFTSWLGKNVKSLDNGTFNQVDNKYVITTKMLCKFCLKDTGKGCCDLYNNKKRTSKKVVYNMEFFTF